MDHWPILQYNSLLPSQCFNFSLDSQHPFHALQFTLLAISTARLVDFGIGGNHHNRDGLLLHPRIKMEKRTIHRIDGGKLHPDFEHC